MAVRVVAVARESPGEKEDLGIFQPAEKSNYPLVNRSKEKSSWPHLVTKSLWCTLSVKTSPGIKQESVGSPPGSFFIFMRLRMSMGSRPGLGLTSFTASRLKVSTISRQVWVDRPSRSRSSLTEKKRFNLIEIYYGCMHRALYYKFQYELLSTLITTRDPLTPQGNRCANREPENGRTI